jgi:hypothetical protein
MSNGNNVTPFIPVNHEMESDAGIKLNEDQYDIYVNGDLVGQKTLKNAGENLSDIDDFLRNQGIKKFTTSLNGDHYVIQTDQDNTDITDALSVYFNNR